ncbi:MAG: hypothetical protein F6K00_02190 [Leptolyngbya sp. SIOISBB]|nr:hypothetical protein [Leptolyngbya sp. SIOISBB]
MWDKSTILLFLAIPLSGFFLLGFFLLGGGTKNIFKPREVRTAWLPVRGLPVEQATLLQVKNSSRDLEWCLERTGQSSFSDDDFLELVNQGGRLLELETEIYSATSCDKTLKFSIEKISAALESGNSKQRVYEALLEGQIEVVSEKDNTFP